jgi:hypothetical protein
MRNGESVLLVLQTGRVVQDDEVTLTGTKQFQTAAFILRHLEVLQLHKAVSSVLREETIVFVRERLTPKFNTKPASHNGRRQFCKTF